MQFLFIAVALAGAAYFLARRLIDPLAAAYGASLIYFAPAFLGHVGFSKGFKDGAYLGDYASIIQPATYLIMAIVLVAVVAVTVLHDRLPSRQLPMMPGDRFAPTVLLVIMLISAALSIRAVSLYYLCDDKSLTLTKIDYWYYWAAYALPLCLVAAFVLRQWIVLAFCIVIVGADLFVGFRASAAISLISIFVLNGPMLFRNRRSAILYVALVLLGGMSLFAIKTLAFNIKSVYALTCVISETTASGFQIKITGRANSAAAMKGIARAITSSETYGSSLMNSEPFIVQSILNETVRRSFETPADHVWKQALTAVPGGATIFGIELGPIPVFSDLFKKPLFPDVPFGMANNPWAQAYSAGGFGLVAAYALGYAMAVAVMCYLYKVSRGSLQAFALVASIWIAFYFHRNDLMSEIGILKQTVHLSIAAMAVSAAIAGLVKLMNTGRRHTP